MIDEEEMQRRFSERMSKLCSDARLTRGKYILNDDNEIIPIADLQVWGEWMGSPYTAFKRVLSRTYITPEIYVSTVFLGMDHDHSYLEENNTPNPAPILWESMAFNGHESGKMERYTTREQAIEGHLQMVEELRSIRAILNREQK